MQPGELLLPVENQPFAQPTVQIQRFPRKLMLRACLGGPKLSPKCEEDVNGNPRRNLARLNSDGSLDTFFDAGVALPGFATSIALQADSNVLVSGGVFANPDSIQGFVIRVTGGRALRFQNVTQDACGALRLRILNGTGKPWVLQGSSNPMLWSNLTTNLSSNNISTDSDSS